MLGIYISIFIILANILFICAIYSCIKVAHKHMHAWHVHETAVCSLCKSLFSLLLQLFPAAMQTVSKKIVQSRTNSTLVGVFSIILVFISAFVNMVSGGRRLVIHYSMPWYLGTGQHFLNVMLNVPVCVPLCRSLPVTPRAWRNALLSSWTPPQPWWRPVWSAAWMCPLKGV